MADDVLRVGTFNANSLRVRLPQILDWLDANEVDILGVQETKVQDKDFPLEAIEDAGYHVVYRGQKSHAGVAVLSSQEPEQVSYRFDDQEADAEADAKARLIRGHWGRIQIVNTYVPQGRSPDSDQFQYKLNWFSRLKDMFESQYDPEEPLLWIGDLNVAPTPIDIYDPQGLANHVDFHPDTRAAFEDVCEWGFIDLFRKHHPDEEDQYSYWDYRARNPIERGIGWRVDHILGTEPLAKACVDAWIDVEARKAERPSDHTFMVAEFDLGLL